MAGWLETWLLKDVIEANKHSELSTTIWNRCRSRPAYQLFATAKALVASLGTKLPYGLWPVSVVKAVMGFHHYTCAGHIMLARDRGPIS